MFTKAVKRKFKLLFITVGGFITSTILTILLLPILIIFFILSELVYLALKIRFGSAACRPRGMDILQGMDNERSRAYINTLGRFIGKPDIERIRNKFMDAMINVVDENGEKRFRRLKQVFEKYYGYYLFKDVEDFDIRNHIYTIPKERLSSLLNKTNKNKTEKTDLNLNRQEERKDDNDWQTLVNKFLNKFGTRCIEEGRPKWEVIILQESEDMYTLVYRIHHSITDGIYFTRCILEVVSDRKVNFHPFYNYHQPNALKRIADRLWAFCLLPYGVFRLCFSYEKNPLHGPKLTGKKEYLISKRVPLPLLKAVKRKAKVSMSTVLFSCLSYALTVHFKRRKANVNNIIVLIPIGLQDMSKPVTFKNSFALKGTILPTSITNETHREGNSSLSPSVIRLKQVDRNLERTRRDASFLAIHWLIISLASLLPSCLTKLLLTTKGLTTSFSNVAGPQGEDLYFGGNKQEDIAFWVPDRDPMGMGVSVTGWNGNVLIGLMADTGLIPTIDEGYEFLNDFIEEIYNLNNDLDQTVNREAIGEKVDLLRPDIP